MPRLPTEDDLSRSLPISRGIVQAPQDRIGGSVESLGNAISRTADRGLAYVEEVDRENQAIDYARAKAHWNKGSAELESTFTLDQNPEYGKWGEQFGKGAKRVRDEATALIRNPTLRARFDAETTDDEARYNISINSRARQVDVSRKVAEGKAAIGDMLNVAMQPGVPQGVREKTLREVRAQIDNLEKAGIFTPETATEMRQGSTHAYAAGQAGIAVDQNPAYAVRQLSHGERAIEADPAMMKALIQAESGGDPRAVSPKGAVGLTQILPSTAADIAEQLGDQSFPFGGSEAQVAEYLKNPEVAIRYGKEYMDGLLKRYSGQVMPALAAYNWGMGNVDKWLAEGADPGKLPTETREYVQKIMGKISVPPAPYDKWIEPQTRDRLMASAHSVSETRKRIDRDTLNLAKAETNQQIADDLAQIRETGQPSELKPEQVTRILGPDDGLKFQNNRAEAMLNFGVDSTLASIPSNQFDGYVKSLEPAPNTPNFAVRQKVYESAQRKADQIVTRRRTDPADAVSDSAVVKEAMKGYAPNNPDAVQRLIRARLAAQDQVGVHPAAQMPATREEALAISRPIETALATRDSQKIMAIAKAGGTRAQAKATIDQLDRDAAAQITATIKQVQQTYGPYADRVMAQAIDESGKTKNIGDITVKMLKTMAKGEKPAAADAQALDAITESNAAEQAITGQPVTTPKAQVRSPGPPPKPPAPKPAQQQPGARDKAYKEGRAQSRTRYDVAQAREGFPAPSNPAIDYLLSHPDTAAAFDSTYGEGAAAEWLKRK